MLAVLSELEKGRLFVSETASLYLFDNLDAQLRIANGWYNKLYKTTSQNKFSPYYNRKIRVGYFSDSFCEHPLSSLMVEVFKSHNREQFEFFAFNHQVKEHDPMQLELRKIFDHFYDIEDISDESVIELVKDKQIDIAINLMGYAGYKCRPRVFSARSAPIQISYMYAGTMAMPNMDYIIADKVTIPESHQTNYQEKVIYMPDCYLNLDAKPYADWNKSISRKDLGLPIGGFIFLCLNRSFKLNKLMFSAWMDILLNTKESYLVLLESNNEIQKNLIREMTISGVSQDRVIFKEFMNKRAMLSLIKVSDLYLDTYPYNSHTLAMEVMLAGTPLLTVQGNTFASRVGSSVLQAIGLDDLVARSIKDYKNKAIKLTNHPKLLMAYRNIIKDNKKTTGLFDASSFCKKLENAYQLAYEKFINKEELDHIFIQ